jgi:hypothetical protein
MFVRREALSATGAESLTGDISIIENLHPGLNLYLPLKSPMQMPALAAAIEANKAATQEALQSLHYVHFARFLPAWDYSALWVITVFDGYYDASSDTGSDEAYNDSMKSYLMDFVATMGDIFTAILDFVQDAPRLPVNEYPRDFVDFVIEHNRSNANPWSAYPHMTVIDIQSARSIR